MATRDSTGAKDAKRHKITNREIDALFAQVESAKPPMSVEEMEAADRDFQSVSNTRKRRASLLFLTYSGAELTRRVTNDREFAVGAAMVAEFGTGYAKFLRAVADGVEHSVFRIGAALCSSADMNAAMAAARKEIDEQPDVAEAANA